MGSVEQMKEHVNCPICFDEFDRVESIVIQLPCSHVFDKGNFLLFVFQ